MRGGKEEGVQLAADIPSAPGVDALSDEDVLCAAVELATTLAWPTMGSHMHANAGLTLAWG